MIQEHNITNSALYIQNDDVQMKSFNNEGCMAIVAISEKHKWTTIYQIETKLNMRNQGYASNLLEFLKDKYKDYNFGCSVALNKTMEHLLHKYNIKEYD